MLDEGGESFAEQGACAADVGEELLEAARAVERDGPPWRNRSPGVERLQPAGRVVRALVRSDDDRAQQLRASGVHTLLGDLHDRRTLHPALDGAGSVYVAYPVAAGIVDALANVASVIRELGTSPHVVIMGAAAADHKSPSGIARAHALSEELLLQLGVNFTAVRAERPAAASPRGLRSRVGRAHPRLGFLPALRLAFFLVKG